MRAYTVRPPSESLRWRHAMRWDGEEAVERAREPAPIGPGLAGDADRVRSLHMLLPAERGVTGVRWDAFDAEWNLIARRYT